MKRKSLSTLVLICFFLFSRVADGQDRFSKTAEENLKIKKLITNVEKRPDDLPAHEAFINAININDPLLARQYEKWILRFPKSAITPFAIGKIYEEYNLSKGKEFLLKSVEINPNLTTGWQYLASYAKLVNDTAKCIEYMQRALTADPKNQEAQFDYASLFRDIDAAKYDSLMLNMINHFPATKLSARALYELTTIPFNENEKLHYYNLLREKFAGTEEGWYRAAMWEYYDYLINTDADKAFDLALKMVLEVKRNRGYWKEKLTVARYFIESKKSIEQNDPKKASEILDRISLGNSKIAGTMIDAEETLRLLKAEAYNACGNHQAAYDTLAIFYTREPSVRIRQAMLKYAVFLRMDSTKVQGDIFARRQAAAGKKADFSLGNYIDQKQVSLSDLKGKIVLLTYWFPSCVACRRELPHFEAVLKEVDRKDVAYIGVNVGNNQDDYILDFLKNTGYTFIPLKDDLSKPKVNLPMDQGAPQSFLIDQNGKIIFSDFQISDKNESTLLLMIKEMQQSKGPNIVY